MPLGSGNDGAAPGSETAIPSVAFVIPSLCGGGAEIVGSRWIDSLRQSGYRVNVLTYARSEGNESVSDRPNHFNHQSRIARVLFLPGWIRSRVLATDSEYVVSLLTFTNLAVLIALRVVRRAPVLVVISERSVLSLSTQRVRGGRIKRLLAWLLYGRADGVIAISHPVAADLLRFRVAQSRIFVVPNPAYLGEAINPRPVSADSTIHLVYVGRFVSQKQPSVTVDVARVLVNRGYSVRVTVVGAGELSEAIVRKARELGITLSMVEWCSQWWLGVQDVNCLVLPSLVEGFGNVLVEAAAAGIPVVASSQALGIADAIVPGVTGDLAMTTDPDDLADAVLRSMAIGSAPETIARWLARFSVARSSEVLADVLVRVGRPG